MTGQRDDGYPVFVIPRVEYLHKLTARLQDRLPIWVIYNPSTHEYPGRWVARMHVCLPQPRATRFVMTHDDFPGLRKMLPPWMTRLERHRADPPEIVESWI